MVRKFTQLNSWFTLILMAVAVNVALAKGVAAQSSDTSYLKFLRSKTAKSINTKNILHLSLPPIKPAVISSTKVSVAPAKPAGPISDKLLSNVQIYPNPVSDVLNVKYTVSRGVFVNVKIMDVLGNDVLTLFSQRVDFGEQNLTYNINSKLTRGFYFLRINVGTESINKRISIL
ncbi:T9SS C-terminal target domain-containing protein [Mucilaginibacter terrenus]|uniref:T9SS C-terminal target domain-containing protein n=1 Tax=Mucilaginibacter terrenus TaxID=2482727 RepID=A0A3E2NXX7_9SPHI|nr:T9SS type A sorting domain-containing protein [Mucilaginibacter terrenus]RFZ85874.1 T9SS C-terminal target domain-containing protein [Mucilaginibacter terrenus]